MRLQGYPSPASRKGLSPSQCASLFRSIANALANVLELPPEKRDANSTYNFLATYANHTATEVLDGWIWPEHKGILKLEKASKDEVLVRKRVLILAEKVAMSKIQGGGGLDLQTLLDLSVVYSRTYPSKLRDVFKAVAASPFSTSLVSDIARELVPGFIRLLHSPPSHAQGLYAQRKVAECITAFLRGAKNCPEFIRPFFDNDSEDPSSSFLLAVAQSYEDGLTRMATAYGGLGQLNHRIASIGPRNLTSPSRNDDDADDWQRIWIETKVTLLDAFHIVFSTMLDDLAAAPAGIQLASKGEKAFALVFKLLEGGGSSSSRPSAGPGGSSSIPLTPYLNRSLLTDYNSAHPVEKTLSRVLQKADERDGRLDLLESSLADLNTDDGGNGALKLLLHGAGLPLGIGNPAHTSSQLPAAESASGTRNDNRIPTPSPPKTTLSAEEELEVTLKSSQILDILPDTPNALIRKLLLSQKYGGDPERVLGALLEGAEGVGIGVDAEPEPVQPKAPLVAPVSDYDISQRRNIFDDEELDASKIRVGKRAESPSLDPLADRSFMEQMKADILRRAEAISDPEDESELGDPFAEHKEEKQKHAKGKQKADDGLIDDEDDLLTEAAHFRVRDAGGEDDSADEDLSADDDDEEEGGDAPVTPEIMIELAYIENAAVFQRDANTRRSKARKELKDKTGWDDGQIEGWVVMLERDPARKQKMIDRHTGSLAFRGNVKGMKVPEASGSGHRGGRGGRGGGRGRGRGGGGGGRGGGGGGGGDANSARERAWKDKNKASRANHNRKRGHDKKMAKAGAGIPPGG